MPRTPAPARHRPADDKLLNMDEISEIVPIDKATLRYLRHKGGPTAPPLWKLRRRLVAWRSEILRWLDDERARDEASQSA